jgi:hypothetical protein
MPNRFDPKKMVAKIRKRKYFNAIHKEKLEKLLNETDNFTNYREEHRRRLTQLNATTSALDNYHRTKKLKKGGSVPRSRKPKKVVDENKAMVLSQNKAIAHHTDELKTAINKSDKKVEAWVVGKVERASTDISDVTHYLEGQTEYAEGGKIAERYFVVETFPNGRKRKLMDYPDYDTAEVYARMKTNFRNKGNVITIENSKSEVMKEFKKGGKMEMGGQVGDNALVLSANKMGYIVEVGNGTYTLRFPEGTQSVFKASELQIMKDDEFAKGGNLDKDYELMEMIVLTKDANGKSHNYRFLVSARNMEEAKQIATDLWNKNFGDMDETFYKVMSDSKYRMDYGMADGGEVEGVDLFEDYEDQPKEVEAIISKYEIEDYNYDVLQQMKEELESIGYTMDYGLDAEPIDLRKIGQRGKSEFYAKGGKTSKYNYGRSWHMDKRKFNKSENYELSMNTRKKAMGGMTEYVGMTDGGRYNIVDDGKVVETNVTYSKVIDYANTIAFYDIMDESDMGEVNEIANFEEAVNYLGMVDVEVVQVGADGMAVPNKTQYFIENMGSLKGDVEFILEMNDVNYNTKGEDFILLTTPDKIKFIVSDIEDIDDPKAHDIVVRTINNVLHGTYVEPTKKRFTEGMSEKTAEKILKKLGVVGNAPTNETQKARSQANNGLILFTPEIDKKLFEQYKFGSDLAKQDVVVKIFNPYGQGTWYIMNADPDEPDYLWGIVDLFETEMGSISRDELVSLRISPLKFKLERDISFKPTNAKVIFDGLMDGKHFKFGGSVTYNTEQYFDQEIH